MTRFIVTKNSVTLARNRGYDDAVAGRQQSPPEPEKERAAYLQGWRRGLEQRARISAP